MIKITNVTLKNFLSVGNNTQAIKLDNHGLTLVLGANTDANGGTTRNGAGKTTILQAISFGLFGKPLTRIKVGNLVNNINNKQMLVTIEFERDGKTYRIERGQKPAVMRFFVNDTEQKDDAQDQAQGENRHTQEDIERLIGMSHTMFKHIVALNTFTDPFLKMSVSEQRQVIEELLGVTQISQRAETLKKLIAQTKESIRDQEAHIKATTEANNRIEAAIQQAVNNARAWQNQKTKIIADLEAEISAIQGVDFDAEIALFDAVDEFVTKERDLKARFDAANKETKRLQGAVASSQKEAERYAKEATAVAPEAQIARLEASLARNEKDVSRLNEQIEKLRESRNKIEEDIANADGQVCVCCGQMLTGTDHLKEITRRLEVQISDIDLQIANRTQETAAIQAEEAGIREEIVRVRESAESQIETLKERAETWRKAAVEAQEVLEKHQSISQAAADDLAALGSKPITMFKSRDEVYKAKQMFDTLTRDLEIEQAKENPYTSQVDSLRNTIQEIDLEPLNDLQGLYKHQDFLFRLLTSKDSFIRKRIIDQNLAYLNSRLNQYLDKLGLPHEVRFQSDLTVDITLLGRDFDFEQLSRGEMNRVIMATSWSFRDVWESLNTSLNLLWVDELIDNGLDDQGAEAALEILKKMARDRGKNVFLISHKDNLVSRVSRILMVTKENSWTRFEDDAAT